MDRCEQKGEKQRRHLRPCPPEGPTHLCRKSLAAAGLETEDAETSSWTEAPGPPPRSGLEGPSLEDGKWTPPQELMACEAPPARRHIRTQLRPQALSKRGGAGEGPGGRGAGELATPTAPGRGFAQGSPTNRWRTPRFQSHF